ncbi:hypothetical protein FALBO_10699 [Fusarium albosuccineum]|uniref:Uncharacterized protein n=1 Tax=Fusarium albosuccineum TaxID=1237068 RepID=A0A8H4L6I3_9HYPO|nr:hypothetical protein FALBO_10699 [Fusarium albosuccineum]
MSKVAHRKVIDNLKALHNMGDPVIRLKQTLQTVTHFTNNVDSGTLDIFIQKQRELDHVIQYSNQHLDQDLDDICSTHGLTAYPDIRLYQDQEIPPLKPLFDGNSPAPGTDSGPGAEAGDNETHLSEASVNINAHRTRVLVTFDNRNEPILEPENPLLHGTPSDLQAALGKLREDEGSSVMPKVIKQIDSPVVGVEHVNHLTKGDVSGGFTPLHP